MRGLLGAVIVLAIVASPVFGSEWFGSADYNSNGFIYLIGPGAATYTSAISERFTAKRTISGITEVRLNTSGSGYGGIPKASVSIHADDGSGNPGALLGAASPITVVGKNLNQSFFLGAPVSLTAGNVYHVKITGDPLMLSTDKVRINMMPAPKGGQVDQKVEWGTASTMGLDTSMAGLFYLQGDPLYPDGWYEGKPAEFLKHWEPFFGLYDNAGNALNDGEGAKSGYDRANHVKHYGMQFTVQNVPAAYVDGSNKVQIGRVRVNTKAVGSSLTANLKISLRTAAGVEIASAIILEPNVVAGWNEVTLPALLDVGSQYQVVYLTDGTGFASNTNYYYAENHKTGAVGQADLYQGLAAFGIQSLDSGVTWTTSQDVDYLFGIYVPEPATLGLLVFGGLAVLARKRR